MKRCSRCGEEKPLSEFNRLSSRKSGKEPHCRRCQSVRLRAARYGISEDEVRAFIAVPLCQACGCNLETESACKIDHCHTSSQVRGVVCANCNNCLHAFDNKHKLSSLLIYLWRHEERMSV